MTSIENLFNRFTKAGTYKIDVTFIQPSSKLLTIEIKCPTVTIVSGITQPEATCFQEQQFHLTSPNAINNISLSSPVLLLPYTLQHNLEPLIITTCSDNDLIYSFYLLSIDLSQWKYSRIQRYSNSATQSLQQTLGQTQGYSNKIDAELKTRHADLIDFQVNKKLPRNSSI